MATVRNKILKVIHDPNAESPREWDNFGTMVCWHRRYNLGDVHPSCEPENYMVDLIDEHVESGFSERLNDYLDFLVDYKGWSNPRVVEVERKETITDVFEEHFISLPLYLYDHSGVSMSTGPFSCPWDSGQVGFIFVPATVAHEKLNGDGKSFPQIHHTVMGDREFASLEDLTQHFLRGEVEVYDQYLRGETYGFILLDANGEEEESCWGFIGSNWRTNGIADYVDLSEVKEVHLMEERTRTVLEPVEVEELT